MATEQIDTSLEDEKLISHLSGTLTFSDIASLDNGRLNITSIKYKVVPLFIITSM